jgi:DNA-binding transcriptional LysR family regulator
VNIALSELDQARQELDDAAGLARGSVALAAETLRTVTDLTASFLASHPGVSFRLYQSPAPVMSAQLQAGQVDLCLASQPLPGASVQAEDLAAEPFVTTRPGYWQRALTDQLFAPLGHPPIIACEGDEPYAIRGLISAGVGIGLLPAMARHTARPPVGWLHLDAPGCQRTLRIAWRRDVYLSAAARRFRDFAVSHFARQPAVD